MSVEAFKQGLAVLFVLGLLVAALSWVRRRGWAHSAPVRPTPGSLLKHWMGGRTAPAQCLIENLGRLPLTPQHSLHVVRFGDRALLLALHGSGCSVLGEQPWQAQGVPQVAKAQ
jgi:flagellar biogenesis protein FliO